MSSLLWLWEQELNGDSGCIKTTFLKLCLLMRSLNNLTRHCKVVAKYFTTSRWLHARRGILNGRNRSQCPTRSWSVHRKSCSNHTTCLIRQRILKNALEVWAPRATYPRSRFFFYFWITIISYPATYTVHLLFLKVTSQNHSVFLYQQECL